MPEIVAEFLMLAERKLVPQLFGEAAGVAGIGDLAERRGILMPVLLRDDDGTLPQGLVEIGAHVGGYGVRRRRHRIRGGKTVRRKIKPAAKERRLDKPVADAALSCRVEAGDDREKAAELLDHNRALAPRGQLVERHFHGVAVDHEPPAQGGAVADAEHDALMAEQQIGAVQTIAGDTGIEGVRPIDRRAALQPGPVHIHDRDIMRFRHFRAAVVECEQLHVTSCVAQPLCHRNPEPGLILRKRGDQDGIGRSGHALAKRRPAVAPQ